jgi:preprotein translocase subunit SecB
MSMTDVPAPNGAAPQGEPAPATLNVLAQYVKDFSFENPNAPAILTKQPAGQPQIDIQVNVNARQIATNDFEVELSTEAKAKSGEETLFVVELIYAGIFRIQNVPQENLHPLVMIECPRILFPFARQILADATRNGGFPPLMIDPIDFVALYRQRMAQVQPGQAGTA